VPQNTWTINQVSGGRDGSDLIGCHIKHASAGYDFTSPNNVMLVAIPSTISPFSFPAFAYDGHTWTINVIQLGNPATGTMANNDPPEREVEEGVCSAAEGSRAGAEDRVGSANA